MTDNRALFLSINELPIPIGARNRLREIGIVNVGDLVRKTDKDLMYIRSFGKKSLNNVKLVLADLGLGLGTKLTDWPLETIRGTRGTSGSGETASAPRSRMRPSSLP